jgi:hypothetical protein
VLRRVRATGLTFAPEAGTQRLRDVINKNVSEAQLLETADRVFGRGFDRMKLYFIIGLPTETEEDIRAIVQVGRHALAVARRRGRRAKITLSVSTHVPKPHTPFQWCQMDSLEQIAQKQRLLRALVRPVKGLSLRLHDPNGSFLEAVLARGDRRVADVLERATLRGARFDAWEDRLRMDVWTEAFSHCGVDPHQYLKELPLDARTPWSHVHVGVETEFLQREYRRALRAMPSPPCGKAVGQSMHHASAKAAQADERPLICYDCGVRCDVGRRRERRIHDLAQLAAPPDEVRPVSDPVLHTHPRARRSDGAASASLREEQPQPPRSESAA